MLGILFWPPIPVAARSKAWIYGRSLAGIVDSNPAGGMDVCLLWVLCVIRSRSLRRAGHSSKGVLPSVVCLKCVIAKPRTMRRPRPPRGCRAIGRKKHFHQNLARFKTGFYYIMGCVTPEPIYQQVCSLEVYRRQFVLMSFWLNARIPRWTYLYPSPPPWMATWQLPA
jgi:hypothetical protein